MVVLYVGFSVLGDPPPLLPVDQMQKLDVGVQDLYFLCALAWWHRLHVTASFWLFAAHSRITHHSNAREMADRQAICPLFTRTIFWCSMPRRQSPKENGGSYTERDVVPNEEDSRIQLRPCFCKLQR